MNGRIRPHHLILGFWIGFALFAAASGIAPDDRRSGTTTRRSAARCSATSRGVEARLLHGPSPCTFVWIGDRSSPTACRNWERGAPDRRAHHAEERQAPPRRLPGRRLHADAAARPRRRPHALAHLLRLPRPARGHDRPRDRPPAARGRQVPPRRRLPGLRRSSATSPASRPARRRACGRSSAATCSGPYRIRIKSKPEHAVILGTFLVLGVTGFLAEAFRIAAGRPARLREVVASSATRCRGSCDGHRATSPAGTRSGGSPTSSRFFAFLVILPVTMLRHMFTSPLNMYLRDRERPKGAMKPMPNLMETELESFGASTVEDFTWKQLLDTDACTMCGRCTARLPGPRHRQAARPPRDRAQDRRGHGRHRHAAGVAADRHRPRDHRRRPTRCSSASPPRRSGPARRARRATRSARSTSRSSTRSSTCGATCR